MKLTHIERFMGPTWDPPGADRTQVGPMLAPSTLLSGIISCTNKIFVVLTQRCISSTITILPDGVSVIRNASVLLWATVGTGNDTDIPNIDEWNDYSFVCQATLSRIRPERLTRRSEPILVRSMYDQRFRTVTSLRPMAPFTNMV